MTFDVTSRAQKTVAALIVTALLGSTAAGALVTAPPRPVSSQIAVARTVSVTPPMHAAATTTTATTG